MKMKNKEQFLLENVRIVNSNLISMNEHTLIHFLLYGDNTFMDNTTKRFNLLVPDV